MPDPNSLCAVVVEEEKLLIYGDYYSAEGDWENFNHETKINLKFNLNGVARLYLLISGLAPFIPLVIGIYGHELSDSFNAIKHPLIGILGFNVLLWVVFSTSKKKFISNIEKTLKLRKLQPV